MKIVEVIEKLGLKVYSGSENLNSNISGGYVCDMLSDVMGFISEGEVWITIQNHKNVVAVASLRDAAAVILAKGIQPDEDMLAAAIEEGVVVLGSTDNTFEIAGRLYALIHS
jgi:predicted transcriptional regulator